MPNPGRHSFLSTAITRPVKKANLHLFNHLLKHVTMKTLSPFPLVLISCVIILTACQKEILPELNEPQFAQKEIGLAVPDDAQVQPLDSDAQRAYQNLLGSVDNFRSDALLPVFIKARFKVVNKQDDGVFVTITYEGYGYDYHSQVKVWIKEDRIYNKKTGQRSAIGALALDQRGLVFTNLLDPQSETKVLVEKWAISGGQGTLLNATGVLDRSTARQTQPNVEDVLIYGFIQI
jgi:hypothetical protein